MKFKKRNIQIVDHSTGQTLDFPTFGKQAGEEAINELEQNVDNKIAELKSLVGTPLKASTASAMNNRDKIYVYTGNETGYTNGHWYYYDGTNWSDGGVYNSTAVETDKTLSVENVPADAKKTGDEINKLMSDLTNLKTEVIYPIYDGSPNPSFKIYIDGKGEYSIDEDPIISSNKLYVDCDALNNGDGTAENPFNSLNSALNNRAYTNTTIIAKKSENRDYSVLYMDVAGANWLTRFRNLAIIPESDDMRILLTTGKNATYTLTDGKTYSYKAAVASCIWMFDMTYLDAEGIPIPYNQVASVDDVESTAASWYCDGTNLYVHAFDNRVPDIDLFYASGTAINFIQLLNDKLLYFKNVDFICPNTNTNTGYYRPYGIYIGADDANGKVRFDNCSFSNSNTSAIYLYRVNSIMLNCKGAYNNTDCVGYVGRIQSAMPSTVIQTELGCHFHHSLNTSSTNSNSSTGHQRVNILRVGCVGHDTYGPIFADVGSCRTMMYKCIAYNSTGDLYQCAGDSNYDDIYGKMWIVDCMGYGSMVKAVQAGTESGPANIYIAGLNAIGIRSHTESSTITEY